MYNIRIKVIGQREAVVVLFQLARRGIAGCISRQHELFEVLLQVYTHTLDSSLFPTLLQLQDQNDNIPRSVFRAPLVRYEGNQVSWIDWLNQSPH